MHISARYKRGVGCPEESDTYQRVRWRQYSNLDIVLDSSHTNLNNPRKTTITVVIVQTRVISSTRLIIIDNNFYCYTKLYMAESKMADIRPWLSKSYCPAGVRTFLTWSNLLFNTFFPSGLSKSVTRESRSRFLLFAILLQKLTRIQKTGNICTEHTHNIN